MRNKIILLGILIGLIMMTVSCSSTSYKKTGFQRAKFETNIKANKRKMSYAFDSMTLFVYNINDTLDIYLNDKFSHRLIMTRDTLSSRNVIESIQIPTLDDRHSKLDIYLLDSNYSKTFYLDPFVPFYELHFFNDTFYLNGFEGTMNIE